MSETERYETEMRVIAGIIADVARDSSCDTLPFQLARDWGLSECTQQNLRAMGVCDRDIKSLKDMLKRGRRK